MLSHISQMMVQRLNKQLNGEEMCIRDRNKRVSFKYENEPYYIEMDDVAVFPQCYAAVVDKKMCIRDSTYIIKDGLVHMAHMDIHFGYSVNGVASVSYTHLDVYKRQGKQCADQRQ